MNHAWPAIVALAAVPSDDSAELRRLTEQRFAANAASDRSFYERLLAPSFVLLNPDAVSRTKASISVVGGEKSELFPEDNASFFGKTAIRRGARFSSAMPPARWSRR